MPCRASNVGSPPDLSVDRPGDEKATAKDTHSKLYEGPLQLVSNQLEIIDF